MKRVVALLGVLGFLVAAGPAQAGVLDVSQSSDGTYHMTYWVPRYAASYVHIYGDSTGTIFADRLQPVNLNDSTGTCVINAFGRVSCAVDVTSVSARLSAENDVYRVTGEPQLSSTVYGLAGNDQLAGGAGNDFLYGGSGNDVLDGRLGTNYLFGNLGTDTCVNGIFTSCELP